jgi:glucose dehydrogenase
MRIPLAMALGVALMSSAASAQPGKEAIKPGDWPHYTRDLAGTHFSPLDQINTANVARLTTAWSFRVRPDGGGVVVTGATPIVVDGVLYLPIGNAVVALEGDTGKEIWRHPVANGAARRTVSYWPGDKAHPPRIFYSDSEHLNALDARTGQVVASFGQDGAVALDVPYSSAPTIYRNVLAIGANVGELPVGQPGDSRAFDAVTGKPLWVFHTVPRPGEPGHDTWLDDGWKGRSGTNVWVWYMTVDEKTGTLYMPVGGPSANYYGGDRPGSDLFGNSLVAVDAETGKLKWWFQTVHHDVWDSDLPAPPTLVDIKVGGKTVPALAATGKTAYMFVLDRTTGKPVFGVEEKPVVAGDVPGERYAPTQPIPVKPEPLARKAWTPADVVTVQDTNEAHAAACSKLVQAYGGTLFNSGPFTPFFLHRDGEPMKASINLPANGGSLWGGTAADPRRGLLFVNITEGGSIGYMEPRKAGADYGRGTEGSAQPFDRASLSGPGAYVSFSAGYKDATGKTVTMPCIRPPWGRLVAVDANTGDIVWQTRLGVSDDLPEGKKDTGRSNGLGGPIVTAGGLVFIGATDDHRFRAFDSRTGKELWTQTLDYSAQDVPITYSGKDGRQYVAVVAAAPGGAKGADGKPANAESLVVFALPK